MVYHGLPWFTMVYHGLPWFTTVYHGLPWFTMVYHGLPWFTMVYHGLLWFTMVYHGLPWFTMVYHASFSLCLPLPSCTPGRRHRHGWVSGWEEDEKVPFSEKKGGFVFCIIHFFGLSIFFWLTHLRQTVNITSWWMLINGDVYGDIDHP